MTGPQWALWRDLGITHGSPDDKRDGFIHFSAAGQLTGTLIKHFSAHDRLWLVSANPGRMGPALKWEPSRGGQLFPHLYRAFSIEMAAKEWPLRQREGAWVLPEDIAT
jgi:uncharacterized protein (DUF952 family)